MKTARLLLLVLILSLFVNSSLKALEDKGDRSYSPDGKFFAVWKADPNFFLTTYLASDENANWHFPVHAKVMDLVWAPDSSKFAILTYKWVPGTANDGFPFGVYVFYVEKIENGFQWIKEVTISSGIYPYDLYWIETKHGWDLTIGDHESEGCYQMRMITKKGTWEAFQNSDLLDFYQGTTRFEFDFGPNRCRAVG